MAKRRPEETRPPDGPPGGRSAPARNTERQILIPARLTDERPLIFRLNPNVNFFEPDDRSTFFDRHEEVGGYERNRPYWRQEGKLHFVTWRHGDSLPLEQRQELERSGTNWKATFGDTPGQKLEPELRRQYHRLFNERVQRWLDAGYGSCILRRPGPRDIVVECLKYFHGQRYPLRTFAEAGDHVHVLVIPEKGIDLTTITQTWKSYTAKAIDQQRGRTGMVRKPESYDHIVRIPESLARIAAYVLRHAVKGAYVERR